MEIMLHLILIFAGVIATVAFGVLICIQWCALGEFEKQRATALGVNVGLFALSIGWTSWLILT